MLYPLNSKMKNVRLNSNGTFSLNHTNLPQWLRKLDNHEKIALLLLKEPLHFTKGVRDNNGRMAKKRKGGAPFLTIIALFGNERKNLFVDNTKQRFNDSGFLEKLDATQN